MYLRIGNKPPAATAPGYLNPAWVPVEGSPQGLGAKFQKVFAGPTDWMVSATFGLFVLLFISQFELFSLFLLLYGVRENEQRSVLC